MGEQFDTFGVFIGPSSTAAIAALRVALRYLEEEADRMLAAGAGHEDVFYAVTEINHLIRAATNPAVTA